MKKVFCMLAILVFLTTTVLQLRSDNDVYNENGNPKTVYFWDNEVWQVDQYGSDSESGDDGTLHTSASVSAAQLSVRHILSAYASFSSSYTDPAYEGTWYMRAKLNHDWATDEEPFENNGKIVGKEDGMSDSGSQIDTGWFGEHDPTHTYRDCDAYAEAKITDPDDGTEYRSVAYAPSSTTDIEWVEQKP